MHSGSASGSDKVQRRLVYSAWTVHSRVGGVNTGFPGGPPTNFDANLLGAAPAEACKRKFQVDRFECRQTRTPPPSQLSLEHTPSIAWRPPRSHSSSERRWPLLCCHRRSGRSSQAGGRSYRFYCCTDRIVAPFLLSLPGTMPQSGFALAAGGFVQSRVIHWSGCCRPSPSAAARCLGRSRSAQLGCWHDTGQAVVRGHPGLALSHTAAVAAMLWMCCSMAAYLLCRPAVR